MKKHGPLGLLQFDAHQDTWDDGPGAISHGSFVLEAVREGLIDPARSIQIGIRTVAPRDCDIAIIDAYQAAEMGVAALAEAIRARLAGGRAISPSILIASILLSRRHGHAGFGGMSASEALRLLWALRDVPFCGMDVVEVSPPYDHAEITAIAGATIMQHHLQALALRRA